MSPKRPQEAQHEPKTAAGRKTPGERAKRASKGPTRNYLKHPSGIADQGKIERFAARPPDHGKRERITVAPPDHEKRERFTAGPPDHENRESFTVEPPNKRSTQRGTRLQQLLSFETPLSVFSLGRFWAWGGDSWGSFLGFFRPFSAPARQTAKTLIFDDSTALFTVF